MHEILLAGVGERMGDKHKSSVRTFVRAVLDPALGVYERDTNASVTDCLETLDRSKSLNVIVSNKREATNSRWLRVSKRYPVLSHEATTLFGSIEQTGNQKCRISGIFRVHRAPRLMFILFASLTLVFNVAAIFRSFILNRATTLHDWMKDFSSDLLMVFWSFFVLSLIWLIYIQLAKMQMRKLSRSLDQVLGSV